MSNIPEDVYTEQDADPDTLANLGPLRRLAGTWRGKIGKDVNPKAEGPEHRDYYETIDMQPIDPQSNGPQLLYGLRYALHINTEEEDITFHDQVGYWLWEPATGLIMQTLSIPRGQTALAVGQATPDATTLSLVAQRGSTENGICSTAFLEAAFRTDSYKIDVIFNPDGTWSYALETKLIVRGVETFLHIDHNTLTKIAEPKPNPLKLITDSKGG
jgi:hypothetical protein